jgi:hypothetical protein
MIRQVLSLAAFVVKIKVSLKSDSNYNFCVVQREEPSGGNYNFDAM